MGDRVLVFIHNPKTGGASIRSVFPRSHDGHATLAHRFAATPPEIKRVAYWAAFVRNPWERLHSWWRHANHFHRWSFETYVLKHAATELFPKGTRVTNLLIAAQESWVEAPWVELDFVGRFENLQEDFDRLCDVFEKPRRELVHKHLSLHREQYPHDAVTWTPEMLEAMAPMFEPFAEKYGYEVPS